LTTKSFLKYAATAPAPSAPPPSASKSSPRAWTTPAPTRRTLRHRVRTLHLPAPDARRLQTPSSSWPERPPMLVGSRPMSSRPEPRSRGGAERPLYFELSCGRPQSPSSRPKRRSRGAERPLYLDITHNLEHLRTHPKTPSSRPKAFAKRRA
jgi:hypothetical protein